MKIKTVQFVVMTLLSFTVLIDPVFAGPGGQIASTIFESFWGKVLLVVLLILFMPLIVMNTIKEKLAQRRTRKDLIFMSQYGDEFDILTIKNRAQECFDRVHLGWQNEDLTDVSDWMTDWYWTNQQKVFLDKWKSQGLVNICDVKEIQSIEPLLFIHKNHDNGHEDSKLVISISAKMNDYLKNVNTGTIVEGSEEYKVVMTNWTFTLEKGVWKVSAIDQVGTTMAFIKIMKDLPSIENTVPNRI